MISRFYFILYEVDAPILKRFHFFNQKHPNSEHAESLDKFAAFDDYVNFSDGLYKEQFMSSIKKRFKNEGNSIDEF